MTRGRIKVTGNPEKMFPTRPVSFDLVQVNFALASMPTVFELETELEDEPDLGTEEINSFYSQKVQELAPRLIAEIKQALMQALQFDGWAWKDGSRDIFDTGLLAASGIVTMNNGVLNVRYSAPYANIIHNGGYIQPYGNPSARPVYLPGRPWIDAVLKGGGPFPPFDFEDFYLRNLQ